MVIVAGVLVLKPGTLDDLKPDMLRMIALSRAEPGCRSYSYAVDLENPTVIRVHEEWDSPECLSAHLQTEHLKAWRRRLAAVGIVRRDISAWETASPVSV